MPEEKVSLLLQARDLASRVVDRVNAALGRGRKATEDLAAAERKLFNETLRTTGSVEKAGAAVARMRAEKEKATRATGLFGRAQERLRAQLGALGPVLLRVGGLFGAYLGVRAIARFTTETVRLFFAQERAVTSLGVALARAGEQGEDALRRLASGAMDLQAALNIEDEAMIRATARVSQFVPAFKVGDLERVQFVLAGIASITGDVDTAGQLLGKSLSSNVNILARYGIQMDASASATEKLAQLIADPKLRTGFEILAGNARTAEGRVIGMRLAFDDFRETLGGVLVDMFTVGDGASTLATKIRDLDAWVKRNEATIVGYGRSITGTFELVIGLGKTAFEILGTLAAGAVSLIVGAFQRLRLELQLANNWIVERFSAGPIGALINQQLTRRGLGPIQAVDTQPAAQALADTMLQQRELAKALTGLKDDMSADFDEWLAGYVQTTARGVAGAGTEVEEAIEREVGSGKGGTAAAGEISLAPVEGPGPPAPGVFGIAFGQTLGHESLLAMNQELGQIRQQLRDITGEGMTFGEALKRNIEMGIEPARTLQKTLADAALNGMMQLGSAVESTVADVVSGSKTMGEAFAGAWRGAVSMAANAMADFYQAQAVAAVAAALGGPAVGGGPQGWAAAAKFGAASLAMRAVAGIARGMGGAGAGGAASGALERGADQIGSGRGEATVTIYGSLLDVSDPRVADSLAEALERLSGRRIIFNMRDAAA
ncbi:MAG: hypothetical protein LC798_13450 [Chloroflexi bacterium]|nr:hypothetical protein [Chloroflexota bacterium]